MKKIISAWSEVTLVGIMFLTQMPTALSQTQFERIEFPVGHVFVPSEGYDDNDNVEIVLDGILPNGCYAVSDYSATVDPVSKQIVPHLFVAHRTDSLCKDGNHLSSALLSPVPYTLEIALGNLNLGEYNVIDYHPGLPPEERKFQVAAATAVGVDDMPYAAVSSIWIPDTVRGDLNIDARLIGVLTSSCSSLSKLIVKRLGDVFVVLPTLTFWDNLMCNISKLPFNRSISLGAPGEGRFLIHARSMSGHSVNRVFSAVVPDPS